MTRYLGRDVPFIYPLGMLYFLFMDEQAWVEDDGGEMLERETAEVDALIAYILHDQAELIACCHKFNKVSTALLTISKFPCAFTSAEI